MGYVRAQHEIERDYDGDVGFALVVSEFGVALLISLGTRTHSFKLDWPGLHAPEVP